MVSCNAGTWLSLSLKCSIYLHKWIKCRAVDNIDAILSTYVFINSSSIQINLENHVSFAYLVKFHYDIVWNASCNMSFGIFSMLLYRGDTRQICIIYFLEICAYIFKKEKTLDYCSLQNNMISLVMWWLSFF